MQSTKPACSNGHSRLHLQLLDTHSLEVVDSQHRCIVTGGPVHSFCTGHCNASSCKQLFRQSCRLTFLCMLICPDGSFCMQLLEAELQERPSAGQESLEHGEMSGLSSLPADDDFLQV